MFKVKSSFFKIRTNSNFAERVPMQVLNVAGAKARLAPWIISHFPAHQIYVEPFGGSGAVLLTKERSSLEIYNDLNPELAIFFQTLAQQPKELLKAIDSSLYSSVIDDRKTDDLIELSRRFFQRCNTTWTHSGTFKTQKRLNRKNPERTVVTVFEERKKYLHIIAERIRGVIIERRNALEVIRKYDGTDTLFYVDPPYFGSRKADLYTHEMMDEESHRRLAGVLHECRGAVVLSGYASELYKELYSDWRLSVAHAQSNAEDLRQECLWIKPPQNETGPKLGLTKKRRSSNRANIAAAANCIFTGKRTKREEHRPGKLKYQRILWKVLQNNPAGIGWTEILHKVKIPPATLGRYLSRWTKQGCIAKDKQTGLWRVLNTPIRSTAKVYLTVADRARMNGIGINSQCSLDQIARIRSELLNEIRK